MHNTFWARISSIPLFVGARELYPASCASVKAGWRKPAWTLPCLYIELIQCNCSVSPQPSLEEHQAFDIRRRALAFQVCTLRQSAVQYRCTRCMCVCVCVWVLEPCFHMIRLDSTNAILFYQFKSFGRGCKQPIQFCTNDDTGCVLVISIWDAGSSTATELCSWELSSKRSRCERLPVQQ